MEYGNMGRSTVLDMWGQFITAPKFCGHCGKQLTEVRLPRFDRATGGRLQDDLDRVECPDNHEAWGQTALGTWTWTDARSPKPHIRDTTKGACSCGRPPWEPCPMLESPRNG